MIDVLRHSTRGRTLRNLKRLFVLPFAACLAAAPAVAEDRIALVIGNASYAHTASLGHIESDVAVMADTLRSLDFDVDASSNLDLQAMQEHIEAFGRRIDEAGEAAIGLLFYAGHGFRHEGSNYLLPVDADIREVGEIDAAAVNVDLMLAEIAFAGNDHKLVILDVPIENAIDDRLGVRPGLAAIDAPVGTLVAYGASPEGGLQNARHRGLYPLALANVMAKPGLMAEQVFQEVRLNVAAATDGLQVPWESSALVSPVYLAGPPESGQQDAVADGVIRLATVTDTRTADLVSWSSIKTSDDPSDFADYMARFPDGVFRSLAERRVAELTKRDVARAERDLAMIAYRENALHVETMNDRLITQKRANIRAEPSSDGVIVATLEPNQVVDVTGGVVEGKWLRVKLNDGVEAFVSKPLLGDTPPAADQRIDLAATQPPSKRGLLGRWSGAYQCQWDSIGLILDITDRGGETENDIDAVFSFYSLPGAPSLPSGSFTMTGDYDPSDGTIVLNSEAWVEQPPGLELHDIAGRAAIGGGAISGRIETPGCSDFHLARDSGAAFSAGSSLPLQ